MKREGLETILGEDDVLCIKMIYEVFYQITDIQLWK